MRRAPQTTIASVNSALAKLGIAERLTKGRGYYYFFGGKPLA